MAATIITQADITAAFEQLSAAAIGTGTDADGIADGSDDWDHTSGAAAREITRELGMRWEFSTWAQAEQLARAEVS